MTTPKHIASDPQFDPITIAEIPLGAALLRIELKTYNTRSVISAWRFWRDRNGDLKPGKTGLCASIKSLPAIVAAFNAALECARHDGLLAADEAPQEAGHGDG